MPVKEYLEPEETEKLESVATCLRDKLLVRLLRRLGCRVSEVLNIEVDQIDFTQRSVLIEHLKAHIKLECPKCSARLSKTSVFCPKCGSKVEKAIAQAKEFRRLRKLPIDQDTLNLIREYIERGGPVTKNGRQLLFDIGRQWAWEIFQDLAQKAGLPKLINPETGKVHHVSPHKLRDAFAIHAVKVNDTGDGIRLLQEHLGHQSIATTMKYRKVAGEELRDWFDKL